MLDLIIERSGDDIAAVLPESLARQLQATEGCWFQLNEEATGRFRVTVHDRDFEQLLSTLRMIMDRDHALGAGAKAATRGGSIRIAGLTNDMPSALAAEINAAGDKYLSDRIS